LGTYDDRFDQLLEYDQVGRLKQAFSGREARGLAATSPFPDSPYKQTFQYDAFDERTEKSGRYWRTDQSGASACIPRQVNDTCDAEGNVVNAVDLHRYDAAGKQVHFENWHYTVGDGTLSHPVDSGVVIDQTYDADGQPAMRVETRRVEQPVNGGPETTVVETVTIIYYVYSAVLGGAKVVELDANGNKTSGYVYANGIRLAKQMVQGANYVIWHHANPGTNSWIETRSGRQPEQQEMDPDGADVGLQDPWSSLVEPVESSYLKLRDEQPLYIEGGDPFDFSTGRTIDGLPVSETEFQRRVASGSVVTESLIFGPTGRTQAPRLTHRGETPAATFTWQHTPLLEVIAGSSYIAQYPILRSVSNNEGSGTLLGSDITSIQRNHTTLQNSQGESDCSKFVNYLIFIARDPVFITSNALLGRAMGLKATRVLGASSKTKPVGGFHPALVGVAGEQQGDVYKHILGHAGAILIGNDEVVPGSGRMGIIPTYPYLWYQSGESGFERSNREMGADYYQLAHPIPQHTVREATQELADDRAGREIGYMLTDLRAGKLKGDARTQIFNLLCDH
jgi:hypothetical protein